MRKNCGIKMSDCKFYVDESAKTVICVINKTQDLVLDFIRDNFGFTDVDFDDAMNWYGKFQKSLKMPKSFVGRAKCAPDDTWDEEAGKLIAFSRAKDKCYKSFFKRANLYIQTVDRRLGDMITAFNDFGTKLENKQEALHQKISEHVTMPEDEEE